MALFDELIRDGFVGVCSGDGVELSQKLLHHDLVDEAMMTGGCATYDAIMWGKTKAEREANKKQKKKLLKKPFMAELGAVTPWMFVPGGSTTWSEKDLKHVAAQLVGIKMINSGHVCASPQVAVVDRDWPQAEAFVEAIRAELCKVGPDFSYYAGTQERLKRVKDSYANAEVIPGTEVVFVPDIGDNDYLLRNEVFGTALGKRIVKLFVL